LITADVIRPFVEKAVSHFLETDSLVFTDDGSIPVNSGDGSFVVKVIESDPPRIRFESVMVSGLTENVKLLRRINGLNDGLDYGRIFWHERSVYFEFDLLTTTLDEDTIADACRVISGRVNEFGEVLHREFGGNRPTDELGEEAVSEFGNETSEPGYL
jgi:hypothetical protein